MKIVVCNVKEIVALLSSGESYEERSVVWPDKRVTEFLLHEESHLVADGHEVVGTVTVTGPNSGRLNLTLWLTEERFSEAEVEVVDADGRSTCRLRQFDPNHTHRRRDSLNESESVGPKDNREKGSLP